MPQIRNILNLLLYCGAAIGYLPLAPHLQTFPRIALPAAIVFAAVADRRGTELKGRAALLVSVACFIFYSLQFGRQNLVDPAANMLAVFTAIRVAGEKSSRNFLQTLALALFCLAASTLFDLSPRFVFYLLLLILDYAVSLVLLTFENSAAGFTPDRKELRSIITVAVLQPLVAIPLMLLLFFILPRTQFPVWQGLTRAGADRSGISESVRAGEKSSIGSSGAAVFRAEMVKQPVNSLYWRVIVLNAIKDDEWIRQPPPAEKSISRGGREVVQNIFLEPGRLPYLPVLNTPEKITGYRISPADDGVFPSAGLFGGKRGYQVFSRTDAPLATIGGIARDFYSRPPEKTPPRLKSLVAKAVADGMSDQQRLEAVEGIFAGLNLSYAASGLPTGGDAVENFLFASKKGHCELFAVSFAAALRTAGLPARLVGGYYGGDYNDLSGYYVVTEEKAHVWVEVWVAGKGWTTVDPSRFAVNFEESFTRKRSGTALRWQLFLDSLSYYWNRMVITYDLESQFRAASRAEAGLQGLKGIRLSFSQIAGTVASILLLGTGIILLTGKRKSAEEILVGKFKRVMELKYGIHISDSVGLHEATAAIDKQEIRDFVEIYCGAIYRDRALTAEERKRLGELLKRIAQPDQKVG